LAGVLLNLGYSTFLVYPMGIATKEKVPFAASIVNMAGSLGGAFTPFVVGVVLDRLNWNWVFGLLAASSLITFFLLLSMIEPKPRRAALAGSRAGGASPAGADSILAR
jgi:sugar phosphate permease